MKKILTSILFVFILITIGYSQIPIVPANVPYIDNDLKWQDIRVSLLSTNSGGSNPPGIVKLLATGSSQGVFAFAFDRSTEEEVYTTIQIPHGIYKNVMSPHLHWAPIDNTIGTVTWGIEWIVYNYGSAGSSSTQIYKASQKTDGIARKHQIVEFQDFNLSNVKDSAIIVLRIFRDATNPLDTYNADAFAYDFDCHYQFNTLGSISKYGDDN